MDTDGLWLSAADLVCIERMLGHVMCERLKAYLIGAFGKNSYYHEIRLWAAEKAKQCNMQCEVCYACAFDPGDDLFTRVFRIVSCFEHGTFDITKDDYEDACRELVFHRRRHTTLEIPL